MLLIYCLTTPIAKADSIVASRCLMNFLQLSQAPPELDMEIASCTDEPKEPVNNPKTAC